MMHKIRQGNVSMRGTAGYCGARLADKSGSLFIFILWGRFSLHLNFRPLRPLQIPQSALRLRTVAHASTINASINRDTLRILDSAKNVVVIPRLRHNSESIITRPIANSSSIIPRSRTSNIRSSTKPSSQSSLKFRQAISGGVAWLDTGSLEPVECGKLFVVGDYSLEKVDYFRVVLVHRSIAGQVEGAEACCMFGEFMTPEITVRLVLRNPVFVHVGEEIEFAEGGEEGRYGGAFVGGNGGTIAEAVGGVWGWGGVVLSALFTGVRL